MTHRRADRRARRRSGANGNYSSSTERREGVGGCVGAWGAGYPQANWACRVENAKSTRSVGGDCDWASKKPAHKDD